ncbi:MAG: S9 family peptidase [Gemmatimonadales bacterium]|nr:S9 family peptidase [Gemmatimonadales bacterium]
MTKVPVRATAAPAAVAGSLPPLQLQTPVPPRAAERPEARTIHGVTLVDEYAWLRKKDDPEVRAHLDAENAYTDAMMAPWKPLEDRLFAELRGRVQEADQSVPEPEDGWLYYTRIEEGQQYVLQCRRRGGMDAPEEVLLDGNALAAGHDYFRLGVFETSPDHQLLAYATDTTGAEEFELVILDLRTRELLPERFLRVSAGGVEWAADGRTLFYVTLDDAQRPCRLWRHVLGTDPADDVLVFEEADAGFFLGIGTSRSRRWLMIESGSHTSSEVRLLPADDPLAEPRLVEPRRPGVEYQLAHQGERFLVLTNDGGENFRLCEAPVDAPSRANWRELVAHDPATRLEAVEAFQRFVAVWFRRGGLPGLRIVDVELGTEHEVAFPEPSYAAWRAGNREYDARVMRLAYTSLVTPVSVVDYGMDDRTWTVRKVQPVRGGYDASAYRTERLVATSWDGTAVPVSLVYRLPRPEGGARPLFLTGYGAYGITSDPVFSSTHLSLLDRGFTVAIAHVRGGEELGRRWYEDGKLARKPNTFRDFIAVAEMLVQDGWTSRQQLAINGGSAGGLLMGAVLNERPDLFGACVAEVPFVDALNTMLDPSLPLTVIEYDEWGNPAEPEAFATIRAYAPYENVRATAYPPLLVTAGLHDPRVAYWEPAKWVARLRARKTDGNPLLLRTHMGAGHAGASGRFDYLRETAFKYAFLLAALGLEPPAA